MRVSEKQRYRLKRWASKPKDEVACLEKYCGKLYQKTLFSGRNRILLRDGSSANAIEITNRLSLFSFDLHATFGTKVWMGLRFPDRVGDDYSEAGGPAFMPLRSIWTFIDPDQDSSMWIYHFVSERQDTPTDPAGKFKSRSTCEDDESPNKSNSKVIETSAVQEFRALHRQGHFPAWGQ